MYVLPKHLDEKVARLHLKKIGVVLDELTDEQSAYLNIQKKGHINLTCIDIKTTTVGEIETHFEKGGFLYLSRASLIFQWIHLCHA